MTDIQKDLFGNEVRHKYDHLEIELQLIEGNTFESRLKRFQYIDSLQTTDECEWGDCSGLGVAASLECKLLYEEAKTTYVSGAFVATILLCQAFVEHWLTQFLDEEGSGRQIPRNLDGLLKVCRKEGLMHDYIVDRINDLRVVRNPLSHPKSPEYPGSIYNRMTSMKMDQEELLENDAKKAIEIMFTVLEV